MIVDVGKSPVVLRLKDGSVFSFYNSGIHNAATSIDYYDDLGQVRYSIKVDANDINYQNRALHFVRSYPGSAINNILQERLVIFTNPYTSNKGGTSVQSNSLAQGGLIATPLFEVINPQIFFDGNNFQMTFWTNLTDASVITNDTEANYYYDDKNILKVSELNMSDMDEGNESAAKALCTCPIHFEMLRQGNGGLVEDRLYLTPVIKQIAIIMVIKQGNNVFDFAGGGGNTGFKKHMHTNALTDAGFAVAVYAPSAIITPLAWS